MILFSSKIFLFLCYRELTELLGHKHNIEPVVVSGRNGLIMKDQTSTYREIDEE